MGLVWYRELHDPEWLNMQYWGWGKTGSEIAKEIGCSTLGVLSAMRRHEIPRRGPRKRRGPAIKELGNQRLLRYLYGEQQLSAGQIGSLLDCSDSAVLEGLSRNHIVRRSKGEATHLRRCENPDLILSQDALAFISGELLGDGSIPRPESLYAARYAHSCKHRSYLDWLSKQMQRFGVRQTGRITRKPVSNFGGRGWHYQSRVYPALPELQRKWYPSGVKVVPGDLRLAPVTLRQWFLGDGCRSVSQTGTNISLWANAFSAPERDFLISSLADIGIRASTYARGQIYVWQESEGRFFDYIGPCPIECYEYKWPQGDSE